MWSRMERRGKVRLAGTLQDMADITGDTKTARVARLDVLQHLTHLTEGLLRESYPGTGGLPALLTQGLALTATTAVRDYSKGIADAGGFTPQNVSSEIADRLGEVAVAATQEEDVMAAAN